ncbi:MAG: Phytochrome-like protein cph2 [Elusimicrobia bacterium ADurb.Bin231]|nr:MAG: Phytochrome-like protein cph2 [Elusimicrobia bacterium ADurb.Bin231]
MSNSYLLEIVVLLVGCCAVLFIIARFFLYLKKKFGELEKLNYDLALIHDLSRDVVGILKMEELLPQIMEAFAKAGNVAKGSIMFLDEKTQTLEIKYGIGISARAYEVVKPKLAEGVAGVVAATCESVLIDDTSKEKYLYIDFISDPAKSRPKETLLCLPLIFKGHVLGVVSLDKKIDGEMFSEYDRKILSILANQSAVAIQNARLYENAITDGLTDLYIHKYFHYRLEKEMDRAKRFEQTLSLILFDIDHFKNFNDVYGHQVGDAALVHISGIIKDTMRTSDIIARYGGEEFAVILVPDPKIEQTPEIVKRIAERLRANVENNPLNIKEKALQITISVGVVSWKGEKNVDKDEFIKRADVALYAAKKAGRNRVCAWEDMSKQDCEKLLKN